MMNVDKLLVQIDDLNQIKEYKKLGVTNFLFALKGFSVGYKDFTFDDISLLDVNVYIFSNRILTDSDIDYFLTLKVPENVLGFIVEDIGLYMVLKKMGYKIINFQNHLNNNYKTVNVLLRYYDSLMLNNDLTIDEMQKIINNADKKVCIRLFTREMVLYSRKKLITNYYDYYDKKERKQILDINLNGKDFLVSENEFGACFFNKKVNDLRNVLNKFNDDKVLFYLVEASLIDNFKEFLDGKEYDYTTTGFLDKKTIYKIGGEKDGTS